MGSNEARPQPEWDRAEYETKTKGLAFTKDFQSRQEALMRDPLATVGERVMAWILRRSWGQYRLYAIKDDGQAALQVDIVKELGLDKTSVSHAVAYYKKRGYLENRPKLLYPAISPTLFAPDPNCKEVAEYATFLTDWKVANSTENQRWEDARSTNEFFRKLVRSEYKKSRKRQQSAPVSLLIEKKKIKEENLSSSSAVQSPPAPDPKAEDEDGSFYQKFKSSYPADHYDEAKAKPFFDGKTKAQQSLILERLEIYLSCDRWQDDGGRWIPLASNWLPTCDADPPPRLTKQHNGRPQSRSLGELVEHKKMQDEFDLNASEINDALLKGQPLSTRQQELLDYMVGKS